QTTRTILVPTMSNNADGPAPSFTVDLSSPVGAAISKGEGVGIIFEHPLAKVNITVTPATIPSGGTASVSLTATNSSGEPLPGLPFTFGWFAPIPFFNPASGSFGSVTDNHDGTYTAIFTGTTTDIAGSVTITASLLGQAIASNTPVISITPAV